MSSSSISKTASKLPRIRELPSVVAAFQRGKELNEEVDRLKAALQQRWRSGAAGPQDRRKEAITAYTNGDRKAALEILRESETAEDEEEVLRRELMLAEMARRQQWEDTVVLITETSRKASRECEPLYKETIQRMVDLVAELMEVAELEQRISGAFVDQVPARRSTTLLQHCPLPAMLNKGSSAGQRFLVRAKEAYNITPKPRA